MIRLPNKFDGENITLKVELNEQVDVTVLYPDVKSLDTELVKQLKNVDKLYLTVSNMESSINENRTISYIEIIFKIPVIIGDSCYNFPIISYVSNPYSLIRGFFLGFYKELEFHYEFKKSEIHFEKENLFKFDFNFNQQNSNLASLPQSYNEPLILFNNSSLVNTNYGYTLLNIDKYVLIDRECYKFSKISIGHFLGAEAKSCMVIFSHDKFQVNGIRKWKED
ncbi:hypothetical protein CIRMBP1284_02325 [Enterococcus cecorum]|nr:hypothetical protein CIRMBP1284_02325 [Enterococcus cecorum]